MKGVDLGPPDRLDNSNEFGRWELKTPGRSGCGTALPTQLLRPAVDVVGVTVSRHRDLYRADLIPDRAFLGREIGLRQSEQIGVEISREFQITAVDIEICLYGPTVAATTMGTRAGVSRPLHRVEGIGRGVPC